MLLGILLALVIVVCVALVGVILLQRSEGGVLGMSGGGGAGNFMSARGTGDLLTRTTQILAGVFFALCLLMTLVTGHIRRQSSLETQLKGLAIAPGAAPTQPARVLGAAVAQSRGAQRARRTHPAAGQRPEPVRRPRRAGRPGARPIAAAGSDRRCAPACRPQPAAAAAPKAAAASSAKAKAAKPAASAPASSAAPAAPLVTPTPLAVPPPPAAPAPATPTAPAGQ